MIGAIIGDTVGSRFERRGNRIKTKDFDLITEECSFTDDTVLTLATADCILNDPTLNYTQYYMKWGQKYPRCGFGGMFVNWMYSDNNEPYNSFGNGSAMRVSPVAYAYETLNEVLEAAKNSAEVTHNHPEGIKGAQSTAAAIFMARRGFLKSEIKDYIEETFNYDLSRTTDDIRQWYGFDVTCQGSVPESIICFLESDDYVDCIRLAVSLGGDSDTMAAIAGSIAEAFYKEIPSWLEDVTKSKMTKEMLKVFNDFNAKFRQKT